jgi:hypothetical protein
MAATNTTPLVRQRSQVMLSNSTKARLRGAARAFGSARRSAGQERADKLAVARREGTCNVTAPESDVRIEARPAAKEFVKAEWIRMTYEIRLRPTVLRSRKKAARKIVEIANATEAVQDGRIYIDRFCSARKARQPNTRPVWIWQSSAAGWCCTRAARSSGSPKQAPICSPDQPAADRTSVTGAHEFQNLLNRTVATFVVSIRLRRTSSSRAIRR